MGRYLMFLSYIGTQYNGIQIQSKGQTHVKTIQGVLESLLARINPQHKTKLTTSSRTDAGVHAIRNSVHFDFIKKTPDKDFDPKFLAIHLNMLLRRDREAIRIESIQRVNDDFNCRYKAIGRSYVYRVGVPKHEFIHPLSILDLDKIRLVRPPFNTDNFLRSVEILCGTHDFTAFTTQSFLHKNPYKNTVKNLSVGVTRGESLQSSVTQALSGLDYWDVHFYSTSFLYHQVRAMMSALLQIGRGMLHPDDLRRLLEDPSHRKLLQQSVITAEPPQGLFLKEVHYHPEDLLYTPPTEDETLSTTDASEHNDQMFNDVYEQKM